MLLFGDNGNGKSSLIQAIEYAGSGSLQEFDDAGQPVTIRRYLPHINSSIENCKSKITLSDGGIMINGEIEIQSPKSEILHNLIVKGRSILRRFHLVRTIEERPSDKFLIVKPYFERYLDRHDKALRAAFETKTHFGREYSETEDNYKKIGRDILTEFKRLNRNYSVESYDSKYLLQKIKEVVSIDGINEISNVEDLKGISNKLSGLNQERFTKYASLSRLQTDITNMKGNLSQISTDLAIIIQTEDTIGSNLSKEAETPQDLVYHHTLASTQKWISEQNLDGCPICEQKIDREAVLTRLQSRMTEMNDLSSLVRYLGENLTKIVNNINEIFKLLRRINLNKLISSSKYTSQLNILIQAINKKKTDPYTTSLDWGEALHQILNELAEYFAQLLSELDVLLDIPQKEKEEFMIQRMEQLLPNLENLNRKLDTLSIQCDITASWHTSLENAQRNIVEEILNDIEADVNAYYSQIHNHPPTQKIKIDLKPTAQHSLLIRINFHDKEDQEPKGLLSEAHLDSVSLCIFLALYTREIKSIGGQGILILDDVLTSLDAPHRRAIALLLLEKFSDQQLIITTHDETWFNYLSDKIDRQGLGSKFIKKKIVDWDIEYGPTFSDPETEYTRLENHINSGSSKQEISMSAGRLLEIVLSQMRYNLKISIPAKPSEKYDIGDILPKFHKLSIKTNREQRPPGFSDEGKRHLQLIYNNEDIRNQIGGHFNDKAWNEISDSEVREFGRAVIGLHNSLYCNDLRCRGYVRLTQDYRSAKCVGNHIHYTRS